MLPAPSLLAFAALLLSLSLTGSGVHAGLTLTVGFFVNPMPYYITWDGCTGQIFPGEMEYVVTGCTTDEDITRSVSSTVSYHHPINGDYNVPFLYYCYRVGPVNGSGSITCNALFGVVSVSDNGQPSEPITATADELATAPQFTSNFKFQVIDGAPNPPIYDPSQSPLTITDGDGGSGSR